MLNFITALFSKKNHAFDETFGNEKVKELARLLKASDYKSIDILYKNSDWAEHHLFIKGIAATNEYSENLEKWNGARNSSLSTLFQGAHHIFLAWEARSSARGSEVSEEQASGFFKHLQIALEKLESSLEHNPNDPETYAQLIRVHMGFGSELEILENYFNKAISLVPGHLPAYQYLIAAYNPKWLGSLDMMNRFAKNSVTKNNPLLEFLIQYAACEEHLFYSLKGQVQEHEAFYQEENNRNKILESYKRFKEPQTGKSLAPAVRSYIIYNLLMMGEYELAKKELVKNNNLGSPFPWSYIEVNNNKELKNMVNKF